MLKPEEMPYRQSTIGILVNKQDKFLVVQKSSYKDNEWSFPGGGVDEGETADEAIKRELNEELMTDKFEIVGKSSLRNYYDWSEELIEINYKKRGVYSRGQELTQFFVKFQGENNEVNAGDGIRKVKWVDRKELKSYLIFPGQWENAEKIISEFIN